MEADNKARTRLVTVHMPVGLLEAVDRLVELGLFPNRSEAVRVAVYMMVERFTRRRRRMRMPSFVRLDALGIFVAAGARVRVLDSGGAYEIVVPNRGRYVVRRMRYGWKVYAVVDGREEYVLKARTLRAAIHLLAKRLVAPGINTYARSLMFD